MARRRPKWVKRDDAPRWARLSSWIVGAVVWLWLINEHLVYHLLKSHYLAAEHLIDVLFIVVMATVVAIIAMCLVLLIGRCAAWLNLRFVEGE